MHSLDHDGFMVVRGLLSEKSEKEVVHYRNQIQKLFMTAPLPEHIDAYFANGTERMASK